jgi:rubrerythrin
LADAPRSDVRAAPLRPIEPRPIENRPIENRPIENRPTENRPPEARPADPRPSADGRPEGQVGRGRYVCPFCGSQNTTGTGPCPRCTMEDTLATREATKSRIGPWCVLQSRNPAAPGMRYATLLALVAKGQVGPRSIVRGPTTHQLWRYAVQVRGLSREFGVCYSCGQSVEKSGNYCPSCERPQGPRGDPDALLESRDALALPAPGMAPGMSIAGGAIGPGGFASGARGNTPAIVSQGRMDVDIPAFGQPAVTSRPAQRHAVLPIVPSRSKPNVLSTADLAAALQDGDAPVPGRSPFRRALVMLIFAGLIGGIVLLYNRPDLRDRSQQWIATNFVAVRQRISAMLAQRPAPAPTPANINDADNFLPIDPADASAPRPAPVAAQKPAEDSGASRPNAYAASSSGDAQASAAPSTPPTPAPKPAAPAAVSPLPSQANQPALAADLDRSRILYDRAIDAESRNDWSQAVRYYEAIQRLPHGAWEADLMPRLNYARKMAGIQ